LVAEEVVAVVAAVVEAAVEKPLSN